MVQIKSGYGKLRQVYFIILHPHIFYSIEPKLKKFLKIKFINSPPTFAINCNFRKLNGMKSYLAKNYVLLIICNPFKKRLLPWSIASITIFPWHYIFNLFFFFIGKGILGLILIYHSFCIIFAYSLKLKIRKTHKR